MSITSDAVKHEINGLCASQIKVWFKDHNDRRALNYEQIAIQVHQLLTSKFDFHMPSEIYTNLPRALIKACKGYGKSMADGIFSALNKLNVLSMINSNNILRNLGRTDLFGREQCKMPLKWIVAHLNENQTRFMAVTARLQMGLDRQMNFKTHPRYSGSTDFYKCELQKVGGKTVLVVRVTFEGRRQGYFDLIGSGLKHCGFIDEVDIKRDGIGYRIGYVCTLKEEISGPAPGLKDVRYKDELVEEIKEVEYDINQEDALKDLIDELNQDVIPVQKFESKHAEQIKYFEALINELNVTIQQTDDEISRLAGLNGKNKTERANLIQVVKLLKE